MMAEHRDPRRRGELRAAALRIEVNPRLHVPSERFARDRSRTMGIDKRAATEE